MKVSTALNRITIYLTILAGGISPIKAIEAQPTSKLNFGPYAGDGVAILRPKGCSQAYQDDKNSMLRDLGEAVTLWVAPSQIGNSIISVNYIFIHNSGNDSKFKLFENEFRLRTIPNEIVLKPKVVRMKSVGPDKFGRSQREVAIEFEGLSTDANSISVEFPQGSVISYSSYGLQVKPFRFKLISTNDISEKSEGSCFYIGEKPIDWEPAILKDSRPQ